MSNSRGEQMPEIDRIITGEISVSAHGFSGLHEAAKYLSDYALQLEMMRQVLRNHHTGRDILKKNSYHS